jgi:hypothetical protein
MSMNRQEEYPLALYAAKTWYEHLRDGDESRYFVQHQILLLCQNATKFENWFSIWNVDHYLSEKQTGTLPSPVYYASRLRLDFVLSKLLDVSAASFLVPISAMKATLALLFCDPQNRIEQSEICSDAIRTLGRQIPIGEWT